jgi:diadenosine tetraphosphate (Ap4A) HIT family hydrolase
MGFTLDRRLEDSSHLVTRIDDIQVRVAEDSGYIWLLLIPEIVGAEELHDLSDDLRDRLFALATNLGGWMKTAFTADKINIAAIGNLVPQLHLHVVARHRGDAAWPGPIWGHGDPVPLTATDRQSLITSVATFLETGDTG